MGPLGLLPSGRAPLRRPSRRRGRRLGRGQPRLYASAFMQGTVVSPTEVHRSRDPHRSADRRVAPSLAKCSSPTLSASAPATQPADRPRRHRRARACDHASPAPPRRPLQAGRGAPLCVGSPLGTSRCCLPPRRLSSLRTQRSTRSSPRKRGPGRATISPAVSPHWHFWASRPPSTRGCVPGRGRRSRPHSERCA